MGSDFGVFGLGVMGENLALNIENRGFAVSVFNRTSERTRSFMERTAKDRRIKDAYTISDFVNSIDAPRRILILVRAGDAVDEVLKQLVPRLAAGDLLIDSGNSFFKDTERRQRDLERQGIRFVGLGISGGEEGALKGPCLMGGGDAEGYALAEPILSKIAANVDGKPCAAYLGPRGAGHYVKMVHNGIEYALLQIIAEAYDILIRGVHLSVGKVARIFAKWNEGELNSFLIDATAKVLETRDPDTGKPLVDLVLDMAAQKGTGKWASQDAMDLGVPVPTIDSAVSARSLSSLKPQRLAASKVLGLRHARRPSRSPRIAVNEVEKAVQCSFLASYSQGFSHLNAGSSEYGYSLDLREVAAIWRGGCIIRAKLLQDMLRAFERNRELSNPMVDPGFSKCLLTMQTSWRKTIHTARSAGIPCPAFSSSLDYFDSFRSARLPANIIQALRDRFGAHGYERVDKPGTFHTKWAS